MSLRADLLDGRRIAMAGDGGEELGEALAALGAELVAVPARGVAEDPGGAEDEDRVGEWGRAHRPLHGLVYAVAFGSGGDQALVATLDDAWAAIREVAVGALIEAEHPSKMVLIGPSPGAGPLADAAAAGLESLARTLSVEWARYRVSAVMVAPGAGSTPRELAMLVGFLVSEAGDYLSGCRLELGAVR
jgi:hypothetical protein